jgi:hypothetical protein
MVKKSVELVIRGKNTPELLEKIVAFFKETEELWTGKKRILHLSVEEED